MGTTRITWSSGGSGTAQVYVSAGSDAESLFAAGPSGAQDAPWIQSGQTYRFRLYLGTAHTILLREVTVTRSQPSVSAVPNPVPAGSGLGSTIVTWDTADGSSGQVFVSVDSGAESLFAAGATGTQQAAWIGSGHVYTFRLYRGQNRQELLAATTVTRS